MILEFCELVVRFERVNRYGVSRDWILGGCWRIIDKIFFVYNFLLLIEKKRYLYYLLS